MQSLWRGMVCRRLVLHEVLLHALPLLTLLLLPRSQSTHTAECKTSNASEGHNAYSPRVVDGVNIKTRDLHLGDDSVVNREQKTKGNLSLSCVVRVSLTNTSILDQGPSVDPWNFSDWTKNKHPLLKKSELLSRSLCGAHHGHRRCALQPPTSCPT